MTCAIEGGSRFPLPAHSLRCGGSPDQAGPKKSPNSGSGDFFGRRYAPRLAPRLARRPNAAVTWSRNTGLPSAK